MRIAATVILMLGCAPTIPEGRLACVVAGDCPPGWSCVVNRCVESGGDMDAGIDGRDGGLDGGPGDGGPMDSGPGDGGTDGGLDAARDAGPPPSVTDVESGGFHTCALADGELYCWGDNLTGQLGRPGADSAVPTLIDVGGEIDLLSVGHDGTCVVLTDGVLRCWGNNAEGQVGDGSVLTRFTPVTIAGAWRPWDVQEIERGWSTTCLSTAEALWCWGDHTFLGLGERTSPALTPLRMFETSLAGIRQISAYGASCVLRTPGVRPRCWGPGMNGGNGDGTTEDRTAFVTVLGSFAPAVEVGTGAFHACLRDEAGHVYCWGHNPEGEVGIGTNDTPQVVAVATSIAGAAQLSVGFQHTCVRLMDGTVSCWGRNDHGEVGDGSLVHRNSPVPVVLPAPAVDISAGRFFTCAVLDDSTAWCWGHNLQGQLGDGSMVSSSEPVQVDFSR